jgi:hypothetical protein
MEIATGSYSVAIVQKRVLRRTIYLIDFKGLMLSL